MRGAAGARDLGLDLAPRAKARIEHAHRLEPVERARGSRRNARIAGAPAPSQSSPSQARSSRIAAAYSLAAAGPVDILEAQQKAPAVAPRRAPAFERRADMPEMQITGRARRKARHRRAAQRSSLRVTSAGPPGLASGLALAIRKTASMMPRLSGPSRPPAAGGKPRRLVILLHGLGRGRQRPDRARALLGAAAAGRRIPVAERAVSLRHGALRLSMVQLAGSQPARRCWAGCGRPRRSSTPSSTRRSPNAASPTAIWRWSGSRKAR